MITFGASPAGAEFLTGSALASGQETVPRVAMASTGLVTVAGSMRLTYFTARKSETCTKLRSVSGNTAAVGSTLAKMGLYSVAANGDLTLVASTANTTTLWSAASTTYEVATAAAYDLTKGARYAFAVLVVGATTAPTLAGAGTGLSTSGEHATAPRIGGTVTGQTDLPASVTAATLASSNAFAGLHYGVCVP